MEKLKKAIVEGRKLIEMRADAFTIEVAVKDKDRADDVLNDFKSEKIDSDPFDYASNKSSQSRASFSVYCTDTVNTSDFEKQFKNAGIKVLSVKKEN